MRSNHHAQLVGLGPRASDTKTGGKSPKRTPLEHAGGPLEHGGCPPPGGWCCALCPEAAVTAQPLAPVIPPQAAWLARRASGRLRSARCRETRQEVVLIEAKFWAALQRSQPLEYLKRAQEMLVIPGARSGYDHMALARGVRARRHRSRWGARAVARAEYRQAPLLPQVVGRSRDKDEPEEYSSRQRGTRSVGRCLRSNGPGPLRRLRAAVRTHADRAASVWEAAATRSEKLHVARPQQSWGALSAARTGG